MLTETATNTTLGDINAYKDEEVVKRSFVWPWEL